MKQVAPIKKGDRFIYSILSVTNDFSKEEIVAPKRQDIVTDEVDEISDILKEANVDYKIYQPAMIGTWKSSNEAKNGVKTNYFLLIYHLDNSELTVEENDYITYLLSNGQLHSEIYAEGGVATCNQFIIGEGSLIYNQFGNSKRTKISQENETEFELELESKDENEKMERGGAIQTSLFFEGGETGKSIPTRIRQFWSIEKQINKLKDKIRKNIGGYWKPNVTQDSEKAIRELNKKQQEIAEAITQKEYEDHLEEIYGMDYEEWRGETYADGGETDGEYLEVVDKYNRLNLPKKVFLNDKKYLGKAIFMNGYNGYESTPEDGILMAIVDGKIKNKNDHYNILKNEQGFKIRAKQRRGLTINIEEKFSGGGETEKMKNHYFKSSPLMNFNDFKETLIVGYVYGKEGLIMYYLPNNDYFFNTKFSHKNKQKAYEQYKEMYNFHKENFSDGGKISNFDYNDYEFYNKGFDNGIQFGYVPEFEGASTIIAYSEGYSDAKKGLERKSLEVFLSENYADGGEIDEEIERLENRIASLEELYFVMNEDEQPEMRETIDRLEEEKADLIRKKEKGESGEAPKKRWGFFAKGGQATYNIVDDVNYGVIINKIFNEWLSIKTQNQHDKWKEKVSKLRFGTYRTETILHLLNLKQWSANYPNDIIKRDFLNELKSALKGTFKEGGELYKDESQKKEPTFIPYKDNEIMYSPWTATYFVDDVQYDTLEEAKQHIDEGREGLMMYNEGGGIGFIPMDLEEALFHVAKRGGISIKGVIGILSAMVDAGITEEDLDVTAKSGTAYQNKLDKKTVEIWSKIEPSYKGDLKGNMYFSALRLLIERKELLSKFKPYRKNQKFSAGGETLNRRVSNSALLEYVNFGDNYYVNLVKLTPFTRNNKPYKDSYKYAVSIISREDGQKSYQFTSLNDAERKMNEIVSMKEKTSKITKSGKIDHNY